MAFSVYRHHQTGTKTVSELFGVGSLLLDMFDNINPIVDSNLYRLYANEFNKDISKYSDSEIKVITPKMQTVLVQFIYDNIITKLNNYVEDIEKVTCSEDSHMVFTIPPVAKDAFDDTIVVNTISDAADAIDPIVRLKYTLLENSRLLNQYSNERSNLIEYEGVINLNKEELLRFISITKEHIYDIRNFSNRSNTGAADIKTKLKSVLDYVKALTYLVLYDYGIGGKDWKDMLEYIVDMTVSRHNTECLNMFYKYSHLSLASAICIYPGMILDIKSDKKYCSSTSDSFRFLKLSTAYNILKSKIKEVDYVK